MLLRTAILPAAALIVLWFVWRAIRAERLFPLTCYQLSVQQHDVHSGLLFLWKTTQESLIVWVFAMIAIVRKLQQGRSFIPVTAGIVSFLLTSIFVSGSFPETDPHALPILPLLSILASIGFYYTVKSLAEQHYPLALSSTLVLVIAWQGTQFSNQRMSIQEDRFDTVHVYSVLGQVLAGIDLNGERTIALAEVGAVGLFSKWNVLGLNSTVNPNVFGTGFRTRYSPDSILVHQPSIIAFVSTEPSTLVAERPADSTLLSRAGARGYRQVAAVRMSRGRSLWIFASHTHMIRPLLRAFAERMPLLAVVPLSARRSTIHPR
jgi:hypothetical protein